MSVYDMAKLYYPRLWDKARLEALVAAGRLTEAEMDEIITRKEGYPMPEKCNAGDCPVNARVDALEKEFDRYRGNSTDTHRQMFERISTLEQI